MLLKNKLMIFILMFILSFASVNAATLGFSNVDIDSNVFDFDKAWVISWVDDDYTTDSVVATLTPEDIKDLSGEEFESEQTLTVKVDTLDDACQWNFNTDKFSKNKVVTLDFESYTHYNWNDDNKLINWVNDNCVDFNAADYKSSFTTRQQIHDSNNVVYSNFAIGVTVKCGIVQEQLGTVGAIENQKVISTSRWTVGVSGKTAESRVISNDASQDRNTKIGDNVYIQWQGQLSTGDTCPTTDRLMGIHSSSIGGWRVINEDAYNQYLAQMTGFSSKYVENLKSLSGYDWDVLEDTFNTYARNTLTKANFDYRVTESSVVGGKIRYDLDKKIVFPLYRLIVNADYLTLKITSGIPAITSLEDIDFVEGELTGLGKVTIKNVGDGTGAFNFRVSHCSDGFTSDESFGTGKLAPGESKEYTYLVKGSSTAEEKLITGSCIITVYDGINPDLRVEKEFGVSMTQISDCVPNSKVCGFSGKLHSVKECNIEGTQYQLLEVCSADEVCENNKCISDGSNDEDDNDEDDKFSLALFLTTIGLSLLGGIVTLYYGKPFMTTKSGRTFMIIFAIGVFIGLFFLVPAIWKGLVNMFTLPW